MKPSSQREDGMGQARSSQAREDVTVRGYFSLVREDDKARDSLR
jgi:hypothetical protein